MSFRCRPRRAYLAVPLVASVYALASLWIMPRLDGPVTTYATSVGAAVLLVFAGLGLIAAGVAQWFSRPGSGRIAALSMIAGVAWLAPVWVGWIGGLHLARSVGAVISLLLLPAIAHLSLAYPAGRLERAGTRLIAVLGWIVTGAVTAARHSLPVIQVRTWSPFGVAILRLRSSPSLVVSRRSLHVALPSMGQSIEQAA